VSINVQLKRFSESANTGTSKNRKTHITQQRMHRCYAWFFTALMLLYNHCMMPITASPRTANHANNKRAASLVAF